MRLAQLFFQQFGRFFFRAGSIGFESSRAPVLSGRVEISIRRRYDAVMTDVTLILQKIESGDRHAAKDLLPVVYEELRKLAGARMGGERADHTLQPTALVHEAYLRLVDGDVPKWESRGHFFAAAAEAMRRILIDSARAKARQKRNSSGSPVDAENLGDLSFVDSPERMLELDDALNKLHKQDASVAELVRLRLFAGLSIPDAARAMSVSQSTAYNWWNYAVSWFRLELSESR